MMTIDEAIAFCENQISFSNEEYRKIASWLEELKELRVAYYKGFKEGKRIGYNKAIADAKDVILQSLGNEQIIDSLNLRLEQLKEGGTDEDRRSK